LHPDRGRRYKVPVARPTRPDTHQALLEAARVEFSRRGLERARVEDIARRAGISKGAFYLHFRTKDDAFNELLHRFLGALESLAQRGVTVTAGFGSRPAGLLRSPATASGGSTWNAPWTSSCSSSSGPTDFCSAPSTAWAVTAGRGRWISSAGACGP
jgi:AcrR family transcriptional regulator